MEDGVSDEALLGRAVRGDELAFLLLYERHRDPVYRFVRRFSGSAELAEDATQDCFLSLIQAPSRYHSGRASLRTYLCAAARNRTLTRLKREGREWPLEDGLEEPAWEPRGPAPGPLDCVLDSERQQAVATAVAGLPPLQREAVILFEYEGLTLAEIAQVAATDVGTIKSRLHRAREGLRRALAGYLRPGTRVETAGREMR